MTDKVQKIREEVARIQLYTQSDVLKQILDYIDEVQKEPVKIKKGCKYRCLSDMVNKDTGNISFIGDKIYLAPEDDTLVTEENGWLCDTSENASNFELVEEPVSKEIGYYDHKAVMEALHPELKEDNVSTSIDFGQELYKNFGQVKDFTLAVKIAKKFYEMGKLSNVESNVKNWKEEPVSEDLGDYINELSKQFPEVSFAKLSRIAVRVAKWQKEQFENNRLIACDKQTEEEAEIELDFVMSIIKNEHRQPTYDDAIKYGVKLQREIIMKDAFEREVKVDAGGYPYIPQMELYDYDKDIPLAKEGDKYNVILIKED